MLEKLRNPVTAALKEQKKSFPITKIRKLLWAQQDLNLRPPACKAGALPLSYAPERKRFLFAPISVVNHRCSNK